MATDTTRPAEPHPFQAEVAELLRLMVHSVYSETDIFLRELISNGSDACDKLRYEAIARPELMAEGGDLEILIRPDPAAGTLAIVDNGIGMDRQELIDNLGTIARSGTRAFMSRLAGGGDGKGLIGQFGVGFYSAFMVADRIVVTSRRAGAAEASQWRSDGGAGFEIGPAEAAASERVRRGSEIVLHLKADQRRYLEAASLERIVRTYSDHIQFPIRLAEPGKPVKQVNTASAIWHRPRQELRPADYAEAYRTFAGSFDEPAMTLHYKVEGRHSYAVMLFAPSSRPFDLLDPARRGAIKLYVRRVFISEEAELLPAYLRFVRGVIDSEDLPLNLSREMLQSSPEVAHIRKAVTGRVVGEIAQLAEKSPEAFATVWTAFGSVLKEGIYEDGERCDQLLALARFATSRGGEERTLKQYVADLRPGQSAIYYLVGDGLERLRSSPKLEAAQARGIEVLLLADPVDAFWTARPLVFDGKPLRSLSQGDIDFAEVALLEPASGDPAPANQAIDAAVAVAAIKAALAGRVGDVRASERLTESPACLIADRAGPDRALDRLLARRQDQPSRAPILEINPRHPLVRSVAEAKTAGRPADVEDIANVLLDQAALLDGEVPADPAAFTRRINRLLVRGLTPGAAP